MRSLWLIAVVAVASSATVVRAQPLPPPAIPPVGPTTLPPLLPVPPANPPLPEVPRPNTAPGVEYDPGYLYLPERAPERPRHANDDCASDRLWWVRPSIELAWVPTSRAPSTVRLRIPDGLGGSLPGPLLPVANRSSGPFDAALSLSLGRWFGESNLAGIDASLFLRNSESTFTGTAPGMVVLFPEGRGQGAPRIVAFQDPLAAQFVDTFPATLGTFFVTFDLNYRQRLFCSNHARLEALFGYRFAYLSDELHLGDVPEEGDDYRRNRVSVSNPFHGAQIGLAGEARADGWSLACTAKIAFGVVTPEVNASGVFVGAEAQRRNGFARLDALNAIRESRFAVMPTFNVSLGRQLTDHAKLFVGYTFQYMSDVSRLGDALNPRFRGLPVTDFWVQSVGFGAEWRY
jgi:hypothetical protein